MKKLLTLLLALCLALTLLPGAAFAAGKSGTTDDGLSWKISNGTLTISGKGAMQDYKGYYDMNSVYDKSLAPWAEYSDDYTELVVKPGVTSIGNYAFSVLGLERVTLPEGITAIGDNSFCGQHLTEINLPNSLKTIGSDAFSGTALEAITLPRGIKTIGASAFRSTNLKTVTIPGTISSLGQYAFANLYSLKELVLEPGIRTVRALVFGGDYFLEKLTIPSTVTKVETGAFASPRNLRDIYYNGTKADWKALASTFDEDTAQALGKATVHYVDSRLNVRVELNGSNQPVVTWNAVSGAAKYQVYRAVGEDGAYSRILTTTNLKCTNIRNVESGTTYFYKVRALDSSGKAGAFSGVVSVTMRTAAPFGVQAQVNTSGQPVVTWKAVTGAAKYQVYRAVGENGAYSRIYTTTGLTCTNVRNVEPGTTYFYKVRAVDAGGKTGPFSQAVSATAKTAAPTGVQLKLDSLDRPVVTWDAADGAVKYKVYRSFGESDNYSRIYTTTGLKCTNTLDVYPGSSYSYKVCAIDEQGNVSDFSPVVQVTVPDSGPRAYGELDDLCRPYVRWDAVEGAVKYQVYRAEYDGYNIRIGAWSRLTVVDALEYTDVGSNRDYFYKVRAVYADGTTGSFGGCTAVLVP